MKVVHFGFSDLHPGAAAASYRIHRGLVDLGVDSRMVVSHKLSGDDSVTGPSSPWERFWAPKATQIEFFIKGAVQKLPESWMRRMTSEASLGLMGSGMVRHVSNADPDAVMLHWIAGALVRPSSLAELARFPLVWRLADMWPFLGVDHYSTDRQAYTNGYAAGRGSSHRIDLDRWAWARKKKAIERLPNLTVVTPSRWLATEASRSLIFGNRPVEVIPTSVDGELFQPMDQAEARKRFRLPLETPIVLFGSVFGSSEPRKGDRRLQQAIKSLRASELSSGFLLASFGGSFGGSAGASNDFAGADITQLGRLDPATLMMAYCAADVFVAPSLQENLANTVLESLACGTPVVAFEVGGMPDAIEHLTTGYLARAMDVEDLAGGIRHILELDEASRDRMSRRARSVATSRFAPEREAHDYLSLLTKVVNRG